MKLRLTTAWLGHVREHAPEAAKTWWPLIEKATKDRYDVWLPAIGWLRTFEALERETLTEGGYDRRAAPRSMVRARNVIRRRLNDVERHPAMSDLGVPGSSTAWFPAWISEAGWSPFPVRGQEMVVLCPTTVERGRNRLEVTTWSPRDPSDIRLLWPLEERALAAPRLLDPLEHLPFA